MTRLDDLRRFYALLNELDERVGRRRLGTCSARSGWPRRGVYFFFEDGEERSDSGSGPRVVRVGTHAVSAGSRATLWGRLSAHRGTSSGRGNHRGSVFRLLVGEALGHERGIVPASWARGSSRGAAASMLGVAREDLRQEELALERAVSDVICAMSVVWLDVDDEPGPGSLRSTIEQGAIALLSNFGRPAMDPASVRWLGHHSARDRVRQSGLWNQAYVEQAHTPSFLVQLEALVRAG
jgi:hypothetical protein